MNGIYRMNHMHNNIMRRRYGINNNIMRRRYGINNNIIGRQRYGIWGRRLNFGLVGKFYYPEDFGTYKPLFRDISERSWGTVSTSRLEKMENAATFFMALFLNTIDTETRRGLVNNRDYMLILAIAAYSLATNTVFKTRINKSLIESFLSYAGINERESSAVLRVYKLLDDLNSEEVYEAY